MGRRGVRGKKPNPGLITQPRQPPACSDLELTYSADNQLTSQRFYRVMPRWKSKVSEASERVSLCGQGLKGGCCVSRDHHRIGCPGAVWPSQGQLTLLSTFEET